MSFDGGEPESDPELLESTDEKREFSGSSVEVVDSVGVYPSPRRSVSTDTTTNPGHPNVFDEDRVGDACSETGSFDLGSKDTSPLSSIPHIADVDSCVSIAEQVRNTKILSLTHSPSSCSNKLTDNESKPNNHTILAMIAGIKATKANISSTNESSADPRTELDSHANMCVLGKHSYIFNSNGKTCNVSPFMDELGVATDVPIVDGAVAYDCP